MENKLDSLVNFQKEYEKIYRSNDYIFSIDQSKVHVDIDFFKATFSEYHTRDVPAHNYIEFTCHYNDVIFLAIERYDDESHE